MEGLNKERQLVLLCARKTINKDIKNKIQMILSEKLDWQKIMEYSFRNKVLALVFHNIFTYQKEQSVPLYIEKLISDYMFCNVKRNNVKLDELKMVQAVFEKKGVVALPVKGAYMIDNIYRNRAIRITNDLDMLVLKKDISDIQTIMEELGYTNGFYSADTGMIEKPSTVKRMLYKTKMYNLIPFTKIIDHELGNVVTFDFSFAMDFSLNTTPVEKMIWETYLKDGIRVCKPEFYFIHMCCHHYREASHVAWFNIGSDLNLIKFCDVRELIIGEMDCKSKEEALDFAHKYGLEKAVYFTLYYLKALFDDGYEAAMMKKLQIDDEKFVFEYSDGERILSRKKEFWNSFFDVNNKDEINGNSRYEELMK